MDNEPGVITQGAEPVEPIASGEPAGEPLAVSAQEPAAAVLPAMVKRRETARDPHLGHVLLLGMLLFAGLVCSGILAFAALYFHLFGVADMEQARRSMAYNLGITAFLYVIAFLPAAAVFPLLWKKPFFAGVQWNGPVAKRLGWRLAAAGAACSVVAIALQTVMHLPHKTPIQELLSSPSAAWMMFAFGVTLAPFFEELLFRGFLLPAAATAFDWVIEKIIKRSPPELLENGHPRWSLAAMIFGAATTSCLFALIHASQIANALGVLVMLWAMGMVLSTIRLATRSLAASTLTHSAYNFTLFLVMAIGTHGFHQLPK